VLRLRSRRQPGVGPELGEPAAEYVHALENAWGLRAQVFHRAIIGSASCGPLRRAKRATECGEQPNHTQVSQMASIQRRWLQFEQAHPDNRDCFNDWQAQPVPVTREEAACGLRKARRRGRVLLEGRHRYRLIGLNTILLRPR